MIRKPPKSKQMGQLFPKKQIFRSGKDAHVLKSFLTLQYGQTVAIDRADGPGSAEIDNDTSQHKGKNAQSPLNDAAREPRQQRVACHQQRGRHDRCRYKLRSEEHTSELQSLMRISYAVFCLKKKTHNNTVSEALITFNQ